MKICPRCGKETMRDRDIENALSRVCDKYICSQCGTDEAFEDMGWAVPLSLEDWACNKEN